MVYIVVYTPYRGENKSNVLDKIQSYPSWIQLNENTYLVDTDNDDFRSIEIKDDLVPLCKYGDQLFVGYVTRNAAWDGYDVNIFQWLKGHDKTQKEKGETEYEKVVSQFNLSQMFAKTSINKSFNARIDEMVVNWASNWVESTLVKFDCENVDDCVLLEFIAQLYANMMKPKFVSYTRYVNFPSKLQKDLLTKLDMVSKNKNWDMLTNEELGKIFKEN